MDRESYFPTNFKVRSQEDGKDRFIEGYFIRFNEVTELTPGIYEEVSPEAVIKSLEKNDIRCLFNHDKDLVLGRTGNGTLTLKADERGVFGSCKVNSNDRSAMDVLARVERGDINACSFGFKILEEEIEHRDDGSTKFILKDINLVEVSAVTFPAYPTTSVQARHKEVEQHKAKQLEVRKNKLKEKVKRWL